MDDKHKLTEKLKVIETQIHDEKTDLKGITSKLDIAYAYEEELYKRQISAKQKTDDLRNEHFKKMGEINQLYKNMKDIFDVFTGNFYTE